MEELYPRLSNFQSYGPYGEKEICAQQTSEEGSQNGCEEGSSDESCCQKSSG
jgi:hypothetical protein